MEIINITQIVIAVIGLISIVITTLIAPLIKAKTTTTQWANIVSWTQTAVQAAEVIYRGPGRGEEKRDYVLDWVSAEAAKRGMKIDTDTIRAALENAWKQMTEGGD